MDSLASSANPVLGSASRPRCVDALASCVEGGVGVDLWPRVELGEALDIVRKIGLESPSPMLLSCRSDERREPRAERSLPAVDFDCGRSALLNRTHVS